MGYIQEDNPQIYDENMQRIESLPRPEFDHELTIGKINVPKFQSVHDAMCYKSERDHKVEQEVNTYLENVFFDILYLIETDEKIQQNILYHLTNDTKCNLVIWPSTETETRKNSLLDYQANPKHIIKYAYISSVLEKYIQQEKNQFASISIWQRIKLTFIGRSNYHVNYNEIYMTVVQGPLKGTKLKLSRYYLSKELQELVISIC